METRLFTMRRNPTRTRSSVFRPQAESLEGRALLTRVLALTNVNTIVPFETNPLSTVSGLGSPLAITITGADPAEIVRAIDVRPTDGTLYALTTKPISQSNAFLAGKLYKVQLNPGSAVLTPLTPVPNIIPLTVTDNNDPGIGMDFDPNADKLRVITDSGLDEVIDPVTGGVTEIDPFVTGANLVALTHQLFANPTALVGYNFSTDQIDSVNANTGLVSKPVNSGIFTNTRASVGMVTDATANTGFLVGQEAAGPRFLTVNLATNTPTPAQDLTPILGKGVQIRDIALAPVSGVHLSQSTYFVQASTGNAPIVISRTGGTTLDPVTVHIATANGTAVAGTDYQAVNMDVPIPMGSPSVTVNVPLLNTTRSRPDETFTVTLTPATGSTVTVSQPTNAPVTILAHNPDFTSPSILTSLPTFAVKKKNRSLTSFTLTFSQLLDQGRATNPTNYILNMFTKKPTKKASPTKQIQVSVAYNPAQNMVTLTPLVLVKVPFGGTLQVLSAAPLAQPTGFPPGSSVTTQVPAPGQNPTTITVPNLPNTTGISDVVGNPLTPNNPTFAFS